MRRVGYILAVAMAGAWTTEVRVQGDERDEVIKALTRKVEELDQKVRVLERNRELDRDTADAKSKETPRVSLGASGLSITSADTNFVLRLRGYVQADSRWYVGDHLPVNDTFLMRRVRPILEGTVYEKFDYRLMLDFGANTSGTGNNTSNNGMIYDAYFNARLLPEFQVQAGKFKEPVGLERLQSGANLLFEERSFPTQLVPNRDVGVQVQGALWDGRLSYALGVFNGVQDGGSNDIEGGDDEKDVAARLFAVPFKNSDIAAVRGLGFGVAGTFGNQDGPLRTFVTPGQQRFFAYRTGVGTNASTANVVADGDHWRISPQAYYYLGPFGIFGEYVISDQQVHRDAGGRTYDRVVNTAWQVAASYYVTGEDNSFAPVIPRRPFNLHGDGWGALELAARVGQLSVDPDAFPLLANPTSSAEEATSWGIGLNWYPNRNLKLSLNYEQTEFKGGTGKLLDNGEKAILTRAQIQF